MNINKRFSNVTLDFAAMEMAKYLRMMMPEEREIPIVLDPEAKDGFRLGLLEDFGLPCEVENTKFDDVIHIEADENGGILAGSNPRSVLFAVYRYFKLQGCRWLFPGPEGEFIPQKKIEKVSYHKAGDHRFRGHTIEGSPSLRHVLDYIDFHAKEELNSFGLYGITEYQTRYYNHNFNEKNRPAEGYNPEQAESQWRALYESEIKKRGQIQFSGEHGLIPAALGIRYSDREAIKSGKMKLPEEVIPFLALLDGERKLIKNDINYTQLCYSNPEVQRRIVEAAISIAQSNPHYDFYGITFGDASRNHCECEECKKSRPADKYVDILNQIDEKMTEKGLKTKILFSFYTDMCFPPEKEKIKNPSRFLFQYAPIYRSYTSSFQEGAVLPEPPAYKYNAWTPPSSSEETYALFRSWDHAFQGPTSVFEYHFWLKNHRDPGRITYARRVYEDTFAYRFMNMDGCMEDGTCQNFFPNGFDGHIYAETLMNRDLDYDAELEDFYSHLYGQDWKKVYDYLSKISDAFDFAYLLGEQGKVEAMGPYYDPDRVQRLAKVFEATEEIRGIIDAHTLIPIRPTSCAWRLLERHTHWCEGLARAMTEKCKGNTDGAVALFEELIESFGKYDVELEGFNDFTLAYRAFSPLIRKKYIGEETY